MDNYRREMNYAKQEFLRVSKSSNSWEDAIGVRTFTPAQDRRLRKVHNRRKGSLDNLALAGRKTTRDLLTLQATPCPVCGMNGDPRDIPCVTKGNKPASRPHKGRVS